MRTLGVRLTIATASIGLAVMAVFLVAVTAFGGPLISHPLA
jgi:hypothetical protein